MSSLPRESVPLQDRYEPAVALIDVCPSPLRQHLVFHAHVTLGSRYSRTQALQQCSRQPETHCSIPVQVYDVWPFTVGPFIQSGLVPLVLAPIWVLYVYLQPFMDNLWPGVSPCNSLTPFCHPVACSVALHES